MRDLVFNCGYTSVMELSSIETTELDSVDAFKMVRDINCILDSNAENDLRSISVLITCNSEVICKVEPK